MIIITIDFYDTLFNYIVKSIICRIIIIFIGYYVVSAVEIIIFDIYILDKNFFLQDSETRLLFLITEDH